MKPLTIQGSLALLPTALSIPASADSFYKEPTLFTTTPPDTKSMETIGNFVPVGIAIDPHQPAFQMWVGDIAPKNKDVSINPCGDDRPETSFVHNGKNGNLALAMAAASSQTREGEDCTYARTRPRPHHADRHPDAVTRHRSHRLALPENPARPTRSNHQGRELTFSSRLPSSSPVRTMNPS